MLNFFQRLQGHKHLWEGGGVASPIHFCTREAKWLISRPTCSIQSQIQTGTFSFHCLVVYFSLLSCYINQQTQPYRCNMYWFFIQHYSMFRLPTSAIIRLPSVHKKNKNGRSLPTNSGVKIYEILTNIIRKKGVITYRMH